MRRLLMPALRPLLTALPCALSCALLLFSASLQAAAPVEVDRIVAVVGSEVVTQIELSQRLDSAIGQLKRQGTPLPPRNVLQEQMLERLIMERLQLQQARELGIRVDDQQLDQALGRIAATNQLTPEAFRQALAQDNIPWGKFREQVRDEITVVRLREREVEARITIGEAEIDNFLAQESKREGAGEEFHAAHILLRAPEGASPEQIARLREKAQQLVERLRQGEDFAQLAAAYSDAPDGLKGGDLGWRAYDKLPRLFASNLVRLQPGGVTELLKSANGFHLVKLLERRGGIALPPVEQTHARHILIRPSEIVSESEARHKLEGLRDRLQHGADFAELARLYSQDGSAAKGGDLSWLYPGDTVPEFERAMNALQPGQLSPVVKSPFGFHLIEVLERRVQEVSRERQRMVARQTLKERRMDDAYQDWLRQLRDRATVELRIDDN